MSGFAPEWLALRELVDARSRDNSLLAEIACSSSDILRVVDLGAGSGNNLTYLAPRLQGPQSWTLIDQDAVLLSKVSPPETELPLEVACRQFNLASGVEDLSLEPFDLVTCSALFDLVSVGWLTDFAVHCREAGIWQGLFALTADGSISWSPQEPEDDEITMLVGKHMRMDKGFGPALGFDAAPALVNLFQIAGYRVRTGSSMWKLSPHEIEIQTALLDGYAAAALETSPAHAAMIESWAKRRRAHLGDGKSWLNVGHCDVVVRRDSFGRDERHGGA